VKEISVTELRRNLHAVLKDASREDVRITRHGKVIARLTRTNGHLIGALKGKLRVDPNDNLFSTGIRWHAEDGILLSQELPNWEEIEYPRMR
jgi:antitoxin (DNA-binding transcriptional repressor) of toxin-antitoxin stability system